MTTRWLSPLTTADRDDSDGADPEDDDDKRLMLPLLSVPWLPLLLLRRAESDPRPFVMTGAARRDDGADFSCPFEGVPALASVVVAEG